MPVSVTAPHIVVMGVSGAGKSTVARSIAERTGASLLDADDLHPPGNRRKLRAGVPLTDSDRGPWLAAVRDRMREWDEPGPTGPHPPGPDIGLVLACSALRRAYRDVLREVRRPVFFVELRPDAELIAARLAARRGHFASERILESQLRTLEPLDDDERGLVCPITMTPAEIAAEVLTAVGDRATPPEQLDSGRDPGPR